MKSTVFEKGPVIALGQGLISLSEEGKSTRESHKFRGQG